MMLMVVTLCAAVSLLGHAHCGTIPSEMLLPPLVEEPVREEEMVAVGGDEDDGQMEEEMQAIGADVVEGAGREKREVTGSCPSGWSQREQRCYKYESTLRTWAEAEMYCLDQYEANLVSVHSDGEYHFLQRITSGYCWLGGYDATQENMWLWSDGSKMVYKNWAIGEPNNYNDDQHCMVMNSAAGNLYWDDQYCNRRYPSFCAKPAV